MDDAIRVLLTNAGAAGLIALLAWAASLTIRRHAVVHGLWLLALVRLVTPPIAPLPLVPAWPGLALALAPPAPTVVAIPPPGAWSPDGARSSSWTPATAVGVTTPVEDYAVPVATARLARADLASPAASPAAGPATSIPPTGSWLGWRAAAWLSVVAGALAISLLTVRRFVRFGRLLACARPAPLSVADRSSALAARIGLRNAPPVLLVPARIPPMLWPERGGPLLLLPERLMADLRADELDALLAHELAHVRRRDHWVRLVEIVATALFWWYPVTWWARRALRRAEERCCDEWVLRLLPRSAEAYANGLLKSLTFVAESPVPAVASGLGPADDLEARLKEILMTRPAPRLTAPLRLALAVAAALGLAVFPTHAQPSAAKDDPAVPATAASSAAVEAPAPAARPAPAAKPAPAPARPRPATPAPQLAPAPPPQAPPAPEPAIAPTTGHRDAERRAIEEQRQKLHQQELELAQKQLELEAQAEETELRAVADRLRAEGKAEEAARIEGQVKLNAQRLELKKRQLLLEAERAALESRLEAEEEALTKQHAIQAEMAAAEKRLEAVAAEGQVRAVHKATEELARSLARQIEAFQEAAADAPAEKAELDREIQRLKAALDALKR